MITFVKNDIPFCRVREEGLEALAVEIQLGNGRSFTCTNIYWPPTLPTAMRTSPFKDRKGF